MQLVINNFTQILELLEFPDENTFYFLQILQRKKENPEVGRNSVVIKHYYIRSKEHLEHKAEEIKTLCKVFNARASINLNPRDLEKAGYMVMQKIANQMMNKDFRNIKDAYSSICGIHVGSDIDKRWLIDIDTKDRDFLNEMLLLVKTLQLDITNKNYGILAVINTISGYHIITNPFNIENFKKRYPNIDIHKNNPTLLYYETGD